MVTSIFRFTSVFCLRYPHPLFYTLFSFFWAYVCWCVRFGDITGVLYCSIVFTFFVPYVFGRIFPISFQNGNFSFLDMAGLKTHKLGGSLELKNGDIGGSNLMWWEDDE